jgi:hypothetical protein
VTGVAAGWALIGKRPGTYDDYSVLAASRTPFTQRQFDRIVAQHSPGDPPASHQTGPVALPWVWFTRSKLADTTYVGIAIRDWTPDVDAMNRQIAETRYFCLALDDFLAAGLTYTGLYLAVRGIDLAGRTSDDPVLLEPPFAGPREGALGFPAAAAAAAGLLTGPVALLGGDADLVERLAVLDAVATLLPSGSKAWLTAACWADFGVEHPLRLAFTARARAGDLAVDLRSPDPSAAERPGGARYRDRLVELARERGADAVRRHLAGLTRLRSGDPAEAVAGLEELDLPRLCVAAAREGRLTRDQVHRLDASGGFDALAHDQRLLVLRAYLESASPQDVHDDRALLRRHRLPELDEVVETAVRNRAVRLSWSEQDLLLFAAAADELDAHAAYGRALRDLAGVASLSPRLAPVVGQLAGLPHWAAALAPVIGPSRALSAAVLRRVDGDGAVHPGLLDLLDLEHGGDAWGRFRRLFTAGGAVDPADLDELSRVDPDAVPVVLARARREGDPGRWRQLADAFLGLVRRLGNSPRPSWAAVMRDWPDLDPVTRAEFDFALCRAGEPPRQDLVTADESYWKALIAAAGEAQLTYQQQLLFGDAIAAGLRRGWGYSSYAFRLTLDVLGRLADPHVRPHVVTQRLVAAVADEVVDNPALLAEPALAPWLPRLEVDPRLSGRVLREMLQRVREDAPPREVAGLVDRAYAVQAMNSTEMAPVLMRRWEPGPAGWVEFLMELNALLHGRGNPHALELCDRWAHLLLVEEGGHRLQPAALAEAQQRLLPQVRLLTHLMRKVTGEDRQRGLPEDAVSLLSGLSKQLGELLKSLGVDEGGGLFKRGRRKKSGDHERG